MNESLAGDCRVYLFEGAREDIQRRANDFLAAQKDNATVRLVDVVFNYQGHSATFGLGLVFSYGLPALTINEVRETHGYAPIPPTCAVTPEMLFAVVQAANPPKQPTTHLGRAWQRFAEKFL